MESGELKGMPAGTYKVSFMFVMEEVIPSGQEGIPPTFINKPIPIDRKYLNVATSGLTCEVKGRTKFDIRVEKP